MSTIWQKHEDLPAAWVSDCGRYEAVQDPVYDHCSLRHVEDPTQSLAESRSLADLAAEVERRTASACSGAVADDFSREPEATSARQRHADLGGAISVIPVGTYCHGAMAHRFDPEKGLVLSGRTCPYWAMVAAAPGQQNGYCAHLDMGDWQEEGFCHLWDQLKACGLNEADPEEDRDNFAWLEALHRGFREQCRWTAGTEFTSWENPLPNLTWSHLPIDKLRHLLEQGGFDWEVREALRRQDNSGPGED